MTLEYDSLLMDRICALAFRSINSIQCSFTPSFTSRWQTYQISKYRLCSCPTTRAPHYGSWLRFSCQALISSSTEAQPRHKKDTSSVSLLTLLAPNNIGQRAIHLNPISRTVVLGRVNSEAPVPDTILVLVRRPFRTI